MKIGEYEKLRENDHNTFYRIEYNGEVADGDRTVAYPASFTLEQISESLAADLVKTGYIVSKDSKKEEAKSTLTDTDTSTQYTYKVANLQNGDITLEEKQDTVSKSGSQ